MGLMRFAVSEKVTGCCVFSAATKHLEMSTCTCLVVHLRSCTLGLTGAQPVDLGSETALIPQKTRPSGQTPECEHRHSLHIRCKLNSCERTAVYLVFTSRPPVDGLT